MIKTFLPDDLEKIVKQEANAEHVSPGAYVTMLVKEALEDKKVDDETDDFVPEGPVDRSNRICINLYGEDANQLKLKANELGISPTAYVRRLCYTRDNVILKVPTDDLREFIDKFTELKSAFVAVVGYIKRGDGEVFKQDIELLKDYMGELRDLFKKQVEFSYGERLKIQNKMMKQLKDDIKKKG